MGEGSRTREDVEQDESNATREESGVARDERVHVRVGGVAHDGASGEGDVSAEVGEGVGGAGNGERKSGGTGCVCV